MGQRRPGSRVRVLRLTLAVVLAGSLVAACGDDAVDGAADTTTTTTSSTTDDEVPGPVPDRWVAIDEDGRLVVPGAGPDGEDRVLVALDHPEECPPPGEPAAGCQWIVAVALSPDSAEVYYETCCEPAPGVIFRVAIGGGEPEMVTYGAFPAVDAGGDRLAVVELQWVTVHDLATEDEPRRFEAEDDAAIPAALHGMTWSPDGTRLAFAVFERTDEPALLHVLDVTTGESLADARSVAGPGDTSWTFPSFRHDGDIAVAEQHLVLPEGPSGPARIVVVDLAEGTVADELEVTGGVLSMDHDPTGHHLLYVLDDGSVHWWSGDDSGTLARAGYLAASW